MKLKKVLVIVNPSKNHAEVLSKRLKSILNKAGVDQDWVEALHFTDQTFRQLNDLREKRADLAFVCGGDGTLLQSAHRLKGSGIPLMGINTGYLGFMTATQEKGLAPQIRRVLRGEFTVQERMALEVGIAGRKNIKGWALNDVLVARGANPHLISVSAKVDGKALTRYRCDGLLVATPTGGTAYTLAAGGPIISPECDVMVVTPICPQALTSRSVVVSKGKRIEIELDESSGDGEVQADGMTLCRIKRSQKLTVQASDISVPLAFLPEIDFFDTVTHKLHWHGDGILTPRYFRS